MPKLSTVVVSVVTLSLVKSRLAFKRVSVPVAVSNVEREAISAARAAALALDDVPKLSTVVVSVITLSLVTSKFEFKRDSAETIAAFVPVNASIRIVTLSARRDSRSYTS